MENEPTPKTFARKAGPGGDDPVDKDLSPDIERIIDREPLDQVRCVRVFGNYYRCNWWSRIGGPRVGLDYDWGGLLKEFVRKSRFLSATMQTGELVIEEVPSVAGYQQARGNRSLVKE